MKSIRFSCSRSSGSPEPKNTALLNNFTIATEKQPRKLLHFGNKNSSSRPDQQHTKHVKLPLKFAFTTKTHLTHLQQTPQREQIRYIKY